MDKSLEDVYFTPMGQPLNMGIDIFHITAQPNNTTTLPQTEQNYTTTQQGDMMEANITDFENDEDSMGPNSSMLLNDLDNYKTFIQNTNQMNNNNQIINDDVNKFISSESSMSQDMKFNSFFSTAPLVSHLQPELDVEPQPEAYFPEQDELEGYTLIKQIGEGAFAKVFKAVPNKNGYKSYLLKNYKEVAIKVARKELPNHDNHHTSETGRYYCPHHHRYHHHRHRHLEKYKNQQQKKKVKTTKWEEIQAEVAIHKVVSTGSPHVVNYIDFQESHSYYFIVLEKINGGEVFDQVLKYTYFSEDLTRHIIQQLALAVKHLHQVGVVHRDIKLENILYEPIDFIPSDEQHYRKSDNKDTKLNEGKFVKGKGGAGIGIVKLTDFGLSKRIFTNNTTTPCGTLGYTAPEVISQDHYSLKVDLWGVGCVLYTLLCGFPPFYEEDADKLRKNICEGQFTFLEPWWNEISQGAKNLVMNLLEVDPTKRYDVDDLLNDPWLNHYDCDKGRENLINMENTSDNISVISSTPYADTLSERSTLLHSAFSQSNSIQRLREGKREFILGTGFIATPQQPLSTILQKEMFMPADQSFTLNLKSSTLIKRRYKCYPLKEKFNPWAKYTQKQNNTNSRFAESNNINTTRITF